MEPRLYLEFTSLESDNRGKRGMALRYDEYRVHGKNIQR